MTGAALDLADDLANRGQAFDHVRGLVGGSQRRAVGVRGLGPEDQTDAARCRLRLALGDLLLRHLAIAEACHVGSKSRQRGLVGNFAHQAHVLAGPEQLHFFAKRGLPGVQERPRQQLDVSGGRRLRRMHPGDQGESPIRGSQWIGGTPVGGQSGCIDDQLRHRGPRRTSRGEDELDPPLAILALLERDLVDHGRLFDGRQQCQQVLGLHERGIVGKVEIVDDAVTEATARHRTGSLGQATGIGERLQFVETAADHLDQRTEFAAP